MSKGYYIVEPRLIDPLMVKDNYQEYAITLMHWLIPELYTELKYELANVEIEVIKVTYLGSYPALGLVSDPYNDELQVRIEATIDRLLRERPISELIKFIAESGKDWKEVTQEIMK